MSFSEDSTTSTQKFAENLKMRVEPIDSAAFESFLVVFFVLSRSLKDSLDRLPRDMRKQKQVLFTWGADIRDK